jgi:hypothetical protein
MMMCLSTPDDGAVYQLMAGFAGMLCAELHAMDINDLIYNIFFSPPAAFSVWHGGCKTGSCGPQ